MLNNVEMSFNITQSQLQNKEYYIRDKEEQYIMIMLSMHQKDITVLNM